MTAVLHGSALTRSPWLSHKVKEMMHKCNLCEKQDYRFERKYRPDEYIEGYAESPVWIVGLNPAHEKDYIDEKTAEEVAHDLVEIKKSSKYFRDFRGVSLSLFNAIGKKGGVAHTDIVVSFRRQRANSW